VIRPTALVLLMFLVPVAAPHAETFTLDNVPVMIHHDRGSERVARRVGEICSEELPELIDELGLDRMTPIDVFISQDIGEYQNALGPDLPRWGIAFAMLREQRIVVDVARATRAFNSLDRVVPHELSHLLLAQKVGAVAFPIWFVEGLAQWQAHEWTLIDSWQLMNSVWSKDTPTLMQLMNTYPGSEQRARAAYRISYAAFTDLFASKPETLAPFLELVASEGSFLTAFEALRGKSVQTYSAEFQNHLDARYHSWLLVFQSGPLFSIAAVLFLVVILRHIIRNRRKVQEMERQLTSDDWDAR